MKNERLYEYAKRFVTEEQGGDSIEQIGGIFIAVVLVGVCYGIKDKAVSWMQSIGDKFDGLVSNM